ncbi:MAG: hypothetical protein A2157_05080 [Deltaproteobacteria bacterium RBG_16_47_11]|nr:MAG: hypothetical protein A2157_05080 [Deltaproteobacteria bacterium RBG_16_47_11]
MFTVKLDDIPEEGLTLSWEERRDSLLEYLRHFSSIDFDFDTPLHGEAQIKKMGESYLIQGSVQALLQLRCVRCLKEFDYPLSLPFDLTLHLLKQAAFEEEIELGEEDLKSNFFEGGKIHLSEIACEQIFLEIPYQPLCREDCRGLCPQCGRDLNLSSCDCTREDWGIGFSVLRKMKGDPS